MVELVLSEWIVLGWNRSYKSGSYRGGTGFTRVGSNGVEQVLPWWVVLQWNRSYQGGTGPTGVGRTKMGQIVPGWVVPRWNRSYQVDVCVIPGCYVA